ncbi:hypothetical protein RBH29_08115 [Herbivorax sp. ANBcel31]|uniref:hypothetical protein n=1 Tax=Herbivorax sp. ANBcel31 TaxID=3069754 RepID=UPI0027B58209|nr:hypothetical protein [Herbivorax sp. ANBcel31]MDQ2086393.1 hypothetical protein [Herbivorax sp. ANBcel31]
MNYSKINTDISIELRYGQGKPEQLRIKAQGKKYRGADTSFRYDIDLRNPFRNESGDISLNLTNNVSAEFSMPIFRRPFYRITAITELKANSIKVGFNFQMNVIGNMGFTIRSPRVPIGDFIPSTSEEMA